MNTIPEPFLSEKILHEIETKKIKTRPKWHFIMLSSAALIGGILLWLTIIYLVSFIFFVLDYSGVWFIPVFGSKSWYTFLLSMPWILIILLIILFFILESFIHRSRFINKKPLIYSLLATFFVVFITSYAITKTSLHEQLLKSADKHTLPIAGPFYRKFGHQKLKRVHSGIIRKLEPPNKLLLQKFDEELIRVFITEHTRLPRGKNFQIGEKIVIFGKKTEKNELEAFGIQRIKMK